MARARARSDGGLPGLIVRAIQAGHTQVGPTLTLTLTLTLPLTLALALALALALVLALAPILTLSLILTLTLTLTPSAMLSSGTRRHMVRWPAAVRRRGTRWSPA